MTQASLDWSIWPAEVIAARIPDLVSLVETHEAEVTDPEYAEKNRASVERLRATPPSAAEIRDQSRTAETLTLGFALENLARIAAKKSLADESLRYLQAAHELFRGGDPTRHPTRPMRQAVQDAIRVSLRVQMVRAEEGDTHAGEIKETLEGFVASAWGDVPPQVSLSINEMILAEFERIRSARQGEPGFEQEFVTNNIEPILAMEFPVRLEAIRERWLKIGEMVAPSAVEFAQRNVKRPDDLSTLLPETFWRDIREVVQDGSVDGLRDILRPVEAKLLGNLKLRLDAKPEFRLPAAEVRHQNQPDTFFIEARELLLKQDARALEKFRNMHSRKSNNPIAKEWYAYALFRFKGRDEIWEIIKLLEDTLRSDFYRAELNWVARWNLACAQYSTSDPAALETLLPVLSNDNHPSEAFELCLLWALDQEKEDLLPALLLKSRYHEAHLLAALFDAEQGKERVVFRDHFRRIARIQNQPDRVFPDPNEQLSPDDLDRLVRDFTGTSLIEAGVEWFRQRLSLENERRFFKNWECASKLNEEAGDIDASWRCRKQQWDLTRTVKGLDARRKTTVLQNLLLWAQRHEFEEEAVRLVERSWRNTSMTESDQLMWIQRLRRTTGSIGTDTKVSLEPKKPDKPIPPLTEHEIDQLAKLFPNVGNAADLAEKAADADRFLNAVVVKDPTVPSQLITALREIVRLASGFEKGPDDETAKTLVAKMKEQLQFADEHKAAASLQLQTFIQMCRRVVQHCDVRATPAPDLTILTPGQLEMALDPPEDDNADYATRIFARVRMAKDAAFPAVGIKVRFSSASRGITCSEHLAEIPELIAGEQRIVECPVEVAGGIEDPVEIRVYASGTIGGISRAKSDLGRVPVRPLAARIPTLLRYITSRPVDADRTDVFHGRENTLTELMESFAGGRLLKLRFVNGIRRVGKSSLMNHLANKCGPEIVPVVLNVHSALGKLQMGDAELVRQFAEEIISGLLKIPDLPPFELRPPSNEDFTNQIPWGVFEEFLNNVRRQTRRRNVLVCFDEMQYLVERIAAPEEPITDAFLTWLRDKAQKASDHLLICTGSETYQDMKNRYRTHPIWANLEPYDISFVDRNAMTKIATVPVTQDGVKWLPEALDRLWDMTEGHPWVIQHLAEKASDRLNSERRRIIAPSDVDWAAQEVLRTNTVVGSLWWNEDNGHVTETHRRLAFLILQNQGMSRAGLRSSQVFELCQKAGIKYPGKFIDEMIKLEVLTRKKAGDDYLLRIRGAFLEEYLAAWMKGTTHGAQVAVKAASGSAALALMLDIENVKITLLKLLDAMSSTKAEALRPRLSGAELADRLLKAASRHGVPRQRWAVADWDRDFFRGDQKAFRNADYMTDIAGDQKSGASDHVLKEKIHWVLREVPDVQVYVIATGDGDFYETIKTLQDKGKQVVLWATQDSLSRAYIQRLKGPDPIQIEWLEDLIFGEPGAEKHVSQAQK